MRPLGLLAVFAVAVGCSSEKPGANPPPDDRIPCEASSDCEDGNPCTLGQCPGGFCEFETASVDGVGCDDDDACTGPGVCENGTCINMTVVDCSGMADQCNTARCDPVSGCVLDPRMNGAMCSDGMFCTQTDTCQSGSCVGSDPVDCSMLDSDCTMGSCDESTNGCVATNINQSGACDDGAFCTVGGTCDMGTCVETARDCSTMDGPCAVGRCDEGTDTCVGDPINEGLGCQDGIFCTEGDTCQSGVCTGTTRDCSMLDDTCNVGVCNESMMSCERQPTNETGTCDDGLFCSATSECQSGACVLTSAECDDMNACTADSCDEVGDTCTNTLVPIPGAEGPPTAMNCTDMQDNDCDGLTDILDPNCQACMSNGDCDDMNDCTTDTCDMMTFVCSNTPLSSGGCNDGLFCKTGDTCVMGVCTGTDVDCSMLDSTCSQGQCSEAMMGACQAIPINPGLMCNDGDWCTIPDTCQGTICTGPARDCSMVEDDCNGSTCDSMGMMCNPAPVMNGAGCTLDACTTGATCTGGVCGGGSPLACDDMDPCTSNACDLVMGCQNPAATIDPGSVVTTSSDGMTPTSVCMVAGSGARVAAWTDLVDTSGFPVAGLAMGAVTIGGINASESADRPGTYFVQLAAAAMPSTTMVDVQINACSQTVTLTTQITIDNTAANATTWGTGGCSPTDGNLRVTVIADDTGMPLDGASVLVGQAAAQNLEIDPAVLFGGAGTQADNNGGASMGVAEYYDYGSNLAGPVTVTAGYAGYAYVTMVDVDAADIILRLPALDPTPPSITQINNGIGPAEDGACATVDAGLVLSKQRLEYFTAFEVERLLGRNRCSVLAGSDLALPENVWLPAQRVAPFLCGLLGQDLSEYQWNVDVEARPDETLALLMGTAPVGDVLNVINNNGGFEDLLNVLNLRSIDFADYDTTMAPPMMPTIDQETFGYGNNDYDFTFTGNPSNTDVAGLAVYDWDGTAGLGDLFLMGFDVALTGGGSTVNIPVAPLSGARGMGIHRTAIFTAFYLDAMQAPSAAAADGATSVLVRDDMSTGEPYGNDGTPTVTLGSPPNAQFSDYMLDEFLGIPEVFFMGPVDFQWTNTTTVHSPLFSMHDLVIETEKLMPVLSPCESSNQIFTENELQWRVFRPFAPDCMGNECFTLPTLPASFPRAVAGAQQKSGFQQLVGSGNTCTGAGQGNCSLAAETCEDPEDPAAGMNDICVSGSGTEMDPYARESYRWYLHLYDLERVSSFDFNAFDFSTVRAEITHEVTNDWPIQ